MDRSASRNAPLDDTSGDARAKQHELYASMGPVEKLARMRDLTLAANYLALAGLEARHPGESRGDLLLRLARIRLGDELFERVYGAHRGP